MFYVTLSVAIICCAQTPPVKEIPSWVKSLFDSAEADREGKIAGIVREMAAIQTACNLAEAALAAGAATTPHYEAMTNASVNMASLAKRLAEVRADKEIKYRDLDHRLNPYRVGDCGIIPWVPHLVQILGDDRAIIQMADSTFLIRGFDMRDRADGGRVTFPGPVFFSGTYRYNTAAGTTKTVLVIEPANIANYMANFDQARKPLNEKIDAAATQAAKFQERVVRLESKTRAPALAEGEATRKAADAEAERKKKEADEKLAANKLSLAKLLLADPAKKAQVRDRLDKLVKDHPDTKAAEEAKQLLKQIDH